MRPLFKSRSSAQAPAFRLLELGRLERSAMETLWICGESSVRQVSEKIGRSLAYTTIMTTLERLFKKGLLGRRLSGRAFLYVPLLSRAEWEKLRAGSLVASFLDGPSPSRDLLMSSFLEAAGQHDETILEELEQKIRAKRREISRRVKS